MLKLVNIYNKKYKSTEATEMNFMMTASYKCEHYQTNERALNQPSDKPVENYKNKLS